MYFNKIIFINVITFTIIVINLNKDKLQMHFNKCILKIFYLF